MAGNQCYYLGDSAKLVAEDTQVQTEVLEMIHSGIHVEACKDCSDACGVQVAWNV